MTDRPSVAVLRDRGVPCRLTHCAWLLGTLLGGAGVCGRVVAGSGKQGAYTASEKDEIGRVEALANKAGIGPFTHRLTEHLIGIGNAPAGFIQSGLDVAESVAKVFHGYFRAHGFKAEFPTERMTVMLLKDSDSYRALPGEAPGMAVGGHYDLDTNRLVMFDLRPQQAELAINAEQVNTFTLVHETCHLLCYNMGILSRQADVPLCVSEGLATFVEVWRPKARAALGGTNKPRLGALRSMQSNPGSWIPVADLLKDDKWFDDRETEQVAYAESWVLVHYLFKKEAALASFRAYLEDLKAAAPTATESDQASRGEARAAGCARPRAAQARQRGAR